MSARILQKIDITINEDRIEEEAVQIFQVIRPTWVEERDKNGVEIRAKGFSDGLTNKLLAFHLAKDPKDVVVVKVYGSKSGLLIDREAEIDIMTLLHEKKCGPELYGVFENGIAYEFLHGVPLNITMCQDPKIYSLIAAEMARVHKTVSTKSGGSLLWTKMREMYKINEDVLKNDKNLADKLALSCGYSLKTVKAGIDELEEILERENIPVAFCHNDLIPEGNIIYDEDKGKVSFIDFEWAFPNYIAYDIANHFVEFVGNYNPDFSKGPSKKFRSIWISEYLKKYEGKNFTLEDLERWVELCIPTSHLFWSLWTVVQIRHSTVEFDFIGYLPLRYLEYKKLMDNSRGK